MSSTRIGGTKPSARRERLAADAAQWLLKTEHGLANVELREQFTEWLLRSPLHVEEYLAAVSTWEALSLVQFDQSTIDTVVSAAKDAPDEFGKVIALDLKRAAPTSAGHALSESDSEARQPRADRDRLMQPRGSSDIRDPDRRRWIAAAASFATLAVGAGAATLFSYRHRRQNSEGTLFQTAVGEQRRVELDDGSVMLLDTNSAVRVHWMSAERHVDLFRGQVHFEVRPNAQRPFTVATRQAGVRVLGTTFDVRTEATVTRVAVVQGLVEVTQALSTPGQQAHQPSGDRAPARVELRAGDRVAITSDQVELNTGPPVSILTAWTQQRLIFRDQSLVDVLSEFNRYQIAPLVITDSRLTKVRISGVFDTRDPSSLLEYLQIFEKAMIRRSADGTVYISASAQTSQ